MMIPTLILWLITDYSVLNKDHSRMTSQTWNLECHTVLSLSLSRSLLRTDQPHMGLEVLSKDQWAPREEGWATRRRAQTPSPPPPRTLSISAISNCLNPSRNGLLTIAGTHSDSSGRGLIPLTNDSFLRFFCMRNRQSCEFCLVGSPKFWVLFCQIVIKLWAFFV